MLVDHEFHDLDVLESRDRLSIDVGHKTTFSQTSLPRRTLLVHLLQGVRQSIRVSAVAYKSIVKS